MSDIDLKIDGKSVKAETGDTVLEAARKAGIEIPTLCAHPELEPSGACRLCVVEIEGERGFPTSCTTLAAEGMVVKTRTPEIIELRRDILKLMLSGHTSPCLVCLHKELCEEYRPHPTKSGKVTGCTFCSNRASCEVRLLAEEHEIDDLGLPIIYKDLDLERLDPFMDRDYNLCILCGRCVRICKKIHGRAAIDFIGRGADARIGTAFQRHHTEAGCLFCGSCIDICPTGALTDRFAKWHGTPDETAETTCILCPLGCSLSLKIKDDKIIATGATALTRESRICAIGRFVLPQMVENPVRLTSHKIRIEGGLRKASYEEAVAEAAKKLSGFTGSEFALIAHASATREEIYTLGKFTREVMKSENFHLVDSRGDGIKLNPGTKAIFTTGDHVPVNPLGKLDVIIAADILPSSATESADVVFGASVFTETDGTFLTASGEIRALSAAAKPPDGIFPDWRIICDIAGKMGSPGFDFDSTAAIREELERRGASEQPPARPDPSPLDDVAALPSAYRGHRFTEISGALKSVLPEEQPAAEKEAEERGERPFRIIEKVEIVPNTHMITVQAPVVAAKCQPGQFAIAIVNEKSERIPYTIADWDREKGTVTMIVLEAGRSSREMALLREGDHLAHFTGPLGVPIEIKNYGTVVCGGGCYGVGAMLPIARALKEAGNRVICIEEASSGYLLHWQDRLAEHCDELVITTKDGSAGIKGGVQEAISMLTARGEKVDQAFIIGCTFMMMLVSDATKQYGIPTLTAMNPIMVDGTGMCGACRVTVGDATKFSCVDGPFLDGHQVNWTELMQRRAAYGREEVQALPQDHRKHEHASTSE
ncbi:MAG: sulfide/dihydroorotate dehydrogenase-like FAD/NAD-binding protein [Fidelibacterota bacterium]|nr:MAG: sulfide/dihydroorotate dehydrogenase-like FAD/NAD-binding protein [Candidatus Neomarinimicrobiota bacterium]